MLIKKPQINIISRNVTLATGEVVLAFFAIIETEGVREIRFLGTKPVANSQGSQQKTATEQVLLIEGVAPCTFGECTIPTYAEIVSPFYTLDFLINQLARAPSVR